MLPPVTTVSLMLLSCLMLLFQVQGGQKELAFMLSSCPPGWQDWNSDCYALYTTPKAWYEAELACEKWPSGHLVSVLGEAEASFVSSLVKSSEDNYQCIWIGINEPSSLGQKFGGDYWKWSNNDDLRYMSWEQKPAPPHGHCGCLTESSGYLKWRDYHCDKELPYVCKYKY